jgi:hypothetical protein
VLEIARPVFYSQCVKPEKMCALSAAPLITEVINNNYEETFIDDDH